MHNESATYREAQEATARPGPSSSVGWTIHEATIYFLRCESRPTTIETLRRLTGYTTIEQSRALRELRERGLVRSSNKTFWTLA